MKMAPVSSDAFAGARDMVERQLAHMVRLIDDLLDASRVTLGKLKLQRARIDAIALLREAAEAVRPLAERMEQRLEVDLPGTSAWLDGDALRLAQAFGNLLANAVKFTPQGGRIGLAARVDGATLVATVSDDGMGIAPEQLGSIFELFVQLDRSLERNQAGLGIGLTLVRRLVELHGGTVVAESEGPGRGSRFTVRLPLGAASAAAPPDRRAMSRPATSPKRREVLVVDDNRDSAESLALLLGLSGHAVHLAHDGAEAIAAAERYRPDAIVLDIGLPGINGYEACRRIRQSRPGHDPLIIALTGWGQEDDRRRSAEAGFDAHLVKPLDVDALRRLLGDA